MSEKIVSPNQFGSPSSRRSPIIGVCRNMSEIVGWIDDVENGMVYGRVVDGENDLLFELPIFDVLEDQRVDLEPGRYVSFPNGYMLIDKRIWTTNEIDQADIEATRLWRILFGEASGLHDDRSALDEQKAVR